MKRNGENGVSRKANNERKKKKKATVTRKRGRGSTKKTDYGRKEN